MEIQFLTVLSKMGAPWVMCAILLYLLKVSRDDNQRLSVDKDDIQEKRISEIRETINEQQRYSAKLESVAAILKDAIAYHKGAE